MLERLMCLAINKQTFLQPDDFTTIHFNLVNSKSLEKGKEQDGMMLAKVKVPSIPTPAAQD